MKATTIFTIFLWSEAVAMTPRLIGGNDVLAKFYPYQVSIQNTLFGNQHECGGAIVSPSWIITAGHCVGIYMLAARVVAGTYNLSNVDGNEDVQIRSIDLYNVIKHPEHNDINNDIALIKMSEPFIFNENVRPLQISKVPCVAMGEVNIFSGWGIATGSTKTDEILQTANMTILPYDECHALIYSEYADNLPLNEKYHICITGVASPCILDTGGPLVQDNRLIGLLSWLPDECAESKIPAIFTNTGYYKDFIEQHVDDLPSSSFYV